MSTNYVSAYSGDDSNTLVTVSEAHAKASGLTVLKSDPPLDKAGRPRGPRPGNRTSAKKAADNTNPGGASASKPEEASK